MKKSILITSLIVVTIIGSALFLRMSNPVYALSSVTSSSIDAMEAQSTETNVSLDMIETVLLSDEDTPAPETDETLRSKVLNARALYRDMIRLHLDNMDLFDTLREEGKTLRDTAKSFRDGGFTLSDEDKASARDIASTLRGERQALRDIHGDAKEILEGLRGQVTLENIDTVISALEEVISILETRHEHFTNVLEGFSEAQALLDAAMV
ncbi:MAG: hypothetical protein K9K93_04960 [Acholeplasmataceae bacterium]|nr:hypothetical protein [Acholeplasmataceae bacterium]